MFSKAGTESAFPAVIKGRWNGRIYHVKKILGKGAVGQVFLVEHEGRRYALKMSDNTEDLMPEIQIFERFQKETGKGFRQVLYDVDDAEWRGGFRSFYVMEFIDGESLHDLMKKRPAWTKNRAVEITLQILDGLKLLHGIGYCYGDLKPENIMICRRTGTPFFIDYGGVTPFGRMIKQYTEDYDRASWRAGLRKSDASYDLFATAIIFLQMRIGLKNWMKEIDGAHRLSRLYGIIRKHKQLIPYRKWLDQVWRGRYDSAFAAYQHLKTLHDDFVYYSRIGWQQQTRGRWIPYFFICSCAAFILSLILYVRFP